MKKKKPRENYNTSLGGLWSEMGSTEFDIPMRRPDRRLPSLCWGYLATLVWGSEIVCGCSC